MKLSHIKDLTPDPHNRRKHTPRNIGMLVDALHKVGAGRSIVIDEHGEVLAGNGVLEAAGEAGITKLHVVDADGQTVVAVRRTGLSDSQKRDLALYDNRVAELAEWSSEQLQADLDAGLSLQPYWSEKEEAILLNKRNDPAEHWADMPEFEQDDKMAWKRLVVNFKCQEDYDAFSRLLNQTLTKQTAWIWYPEEPRAISTGTYDSDT